MVVVDGYVAVVQEATQHVPPAQAVIEGPGDAAAVRHPDALLPEPSVQLIAQRHAASLPVIQPVSTASRGHVLLDAAQRGDALQGLGRDSDRSGLGDFVELAASVRKDPASTRWGSLNTAVSRWLGTQTCDDYTRREVVDHRRYGIECHSHIGPDVRLLGLACTGIEHPHWRLIGVQHLGVQYEHAQGLIQRGQRGAASSRPTRQGGARRVHARAGVNLLLASPAAAGLFWKGWHSPSKSRSGRRTTRAPKSLSSLGWPRLGGDRSAWHGTRQAETGGCGCEAGAGAGAQAQGVALRLIRTQVRYFDGPDS